LEGRKNLLDVLSMAGGLKDDAGYNIEITRRAEWGPIPLPNAHTDASGQFSSVTVPLYDITTNKNPALNIEIMPYDTISVPRGDMVYIIGDVAHPGSIVLGGQKTVSVLQAVAIAAGVTKTAKSGEAKILRLTPGSATRTEVAVNIKSMLAGKSNDLNLQPDDILFVPSSLRKEVAFRTLDSVAGTGITSILFRLP